MVLLVTSISGGLVRCLGMDSTLDLSHPDLDICGAGNHTGTLPEEAIAMVTEAVGVVTKQVSVVGTTPMMVTLCVKSDRRQRTCSAIHERRYHSLVAGSNKAVLDSMGQVCRGPSDILSAALRTSANE